MKRIIVTITLLLQGISLACNSDNNNATSLIDAGSDIFQEDEATCVDGIKNQDEEDIDCGGPCPSCDRPTCVDGIQNQEEEGVDCGGPCPECVRETCVDGIKNQGEDDIDCGGPCPACVLPTCTDNILNQGEERIDCGGPCQECISLTPLYAWCEFVESCYQTINCQGLSGIAEVCVQQNLASFESADIYERENYLHEAANGSCSAYTGDNFCSGTTEAQTVAFLACDCPNEEEIATVEPCGEGQTCLILEPNQTYVGMCIYNDLTPVVIEPEIECGFDNPCPFGSFCNSLTFTCTPACTDAQAFPAQVEEPDNLLTCPAGTQCVEVNARESLNEKGQSSGIGICYPESIAVFETLDICDLENTCAGILESSLCIPTDPENDPISGRCMQRCSLSEE